MPSAAEEAPLLQRIDPYQDWRKKEGAPLVGGIYIKDMKTVEVGPWPRKGVNGALKAVKVLGLTSIGNLKCLVVVVAARCAACHGFTSSFNVFTLIVTYLRALAYGVVT